MLRFTWEEEMVVCVVADGAERELTIVVHREDDFERKHHKSTRTVTLTPNLHQNNNLLRIDSIVVQNKTSNMDTNLLV